MTGRNHYYDNPTVSIGNIRLTAAFWVQWVKFISSWPFWFALRVKWSNSPFKLWRLPYVFTGKKYPVCLSITFSSSKHIQGKMTETRSWNLYLFFYLFFFSWSVLFLYFGASRTFSLCCYVLFTAQVMEAISIWQWVADGTQGGTCRQLTTGSSEAASISLLFVR